MLIFAERKSVAKPTFLLYYTVVAIKYFYFERIGLAVL